MISSTSRKLAQKHTKLNFLVMIDTDSLTEETSYYILMCKLKNVIFDVTQAILRGEALQWLLQIEIYDDFSNFEESQVWIVSLNWNNVKL